MMASLNLPAIATQLQTSFDRPLVDGMTSPLRALAIDSRATRPGDLFVALRGEHADGHDFVESAAKMGAIAAVVERPVTASVPCLSVTDAVAAMTEIAAENRSRFKGRLVAITGSCGKTTVKEMCAEIFGRAGNTVATAGNLNNELGVPLTLSRLNDDTEFAVVEMGAAGPGHIAHLCAFARPNVSTVLNAMEAHLQGFGSVADVAQMKAEIFDALSVDGTAVLALDQPWSDAWRSRIAARHAQVTTYSMADSDADVFASELADHGLSGTEFTLRVFGRSRRFTLPLPGRHNVANALAAASLAASADVALDAIVHGLTSTKMPASRLRAEALKDGTTLIDDSYNANPGSVRAAIDVLAGMAGRRTLLLGAMLELGAKSDQWHREMGQRARDAGIDRLIALGDEAKAAADGFGPQAGFFADRDQLVCTLGELLENSDAILVKGSRGVAMESLVADLRRKAGGRE